MFRMDMHAGPETALLIHPATKKSSANSCCFNICSRRTQSGGRQYTQYGTRLYASCATLVMRGGARSGCAGTLRGLRPRRRASGTQCAHQLRIRCKLHKTRPRPHIRLSSLYGVPCPGLEHALSFRLFTDENMPLIFPIFLTCSDIYALIRENNILGVYMEHRHEDV